MKLARLVVRLVQGALIGTAWQVSVAADAKGPSVPYNAAVRIVNGKRVVELPPPARAFPSVKPPKPGQFHRAQYLIEHDSGLVQCTLPMYYADSCEPADYGQVKRLRTWVVKYRGTWQGCVGLPEPTACVLLPQLRQVRDPVGSMVALPAEVF